MQKDAGVKLTSLAVDGGACRNDFLCSFCADAIDASIVRPGNVETTALGAAYLAGLASGFWSSTDEIRSMRRVDHLFEPTLPKSRREELLAGWADAVRRTRTSESI